MTWLILGLLLGEFADEFDHAVHGADGLRHDEVLAVDDVGRDALDLADVVARLPGVGKRLHVGFLRFFANSSAEMPAASRPVFKKASSPAVQRSPFL